MQILGLSSLQASFSFFLFEYVLDFSERLPYGEKRADEIKRNKTKQ